jgi:hypothetical protein
MLGAMKQLAFALSLLLAAACQSTPATNRADFDVYGAPIQLDGAVPVADVLAAPENYAGRDIRFSGPIQSVCKVKGCWMRIGGEPNVFVKFKDYAFFVPLDADGRDAILEGQIAVKEIPVAEARHYLEDAGKHDEALKITKPVREVTFMASGVALRKPTAK